MNRPIAILAIIGMMSGAELRSTDQVTVTGKVSISGAAVGKSGNGGVVVWLKPLGARETRDLTALRRQRIVQKQKRFEPHLLVVQEGTVVDFPNFDPFFHNVFSLFDGNRFDLGLYEAGASRNVTFTRPGACFIFCNIHPEMSAVVVVVDSPYHAVSNRNGEFQIANVPVGRYSLSVFHERAKPENPAEFPREVRVSADNSPVLTIRLVQSGNVLTPHKNKYGKEYDPVPASPIYK